MVTDHDFYMQLCLGHAWRYQGLTWPNPAVGALILDKHGKILSIAAHTEAGKPHAELAASIEAVRLLGDREIDRLDSAEAQHAWLMQHYAGFFEGATIYVTLEPCMHTGRTPPCSLLIRTLGFSHVVIGAHDPNPIAAGAPEFLRKAGIEVTTGVLEEACTALLCPFRKEQEGLPFIFFKLAKHQNGTISGRHVSSRESREHVHRLRTKIDLLVIGGDTVRTDRPTLDARLAGSDKAPDILIYTSHDDIDRNIPLFRVPGRRVFVEKSFASIRNYRFVMIEGGEGMFHHTRHLVDYYLFFTTDRFAKGKKIDLDANLKSLHSFKNDSDTISWFENLHKESK